MANRLVDVSAERMLHEMEERSDELMEADFELGEAKSAWEQYEAKTKLALKHATSCSMTEAETRMKATPEWAVAYQNYMNALAKHGNVKRAFDRARTAIEVWRTEKASHRTVG